MPHKRVKKALGKVKKRIKKAVKPKGKVKHDLPAISDIPAFFPAPGVGRLALSNPWVAGALIGYTLAEKTQPWWGPPVEAHAEATREDFDRFMEQFSQFQDTGTAYVPGGRSSYRPMEPETIEAPKVKRQVTKANKATKAAYQWLLKQENGKMTAAKCRKLLAQAAKMASKANPATKSRIGKRITKKLKECGKIRRDVWKTNKRY